MAMRSLKSGTKFMAFGAGTVAALLLVVGVIGPGLFDLSSPFSKETIDRSPPVVLTEISDLAEFRAATANFEVILDKEDDVKWVPDFIAGERVQYLAVGSVDAVIDFSSVTDESIIFDEEAGKVVVVLPEPTLSEPQIDFDNSGVMNRDRGVLDRIGGAFVDSPTGEESLIVAAGDKMIESIPADFYDRAEQNTEDMLLSVLSGVGVESVDVVFERAQPI